MSALVQRIATPIAISLAALCAAQAGAASRSAWAGRPVSSLLDVARRGGVDVSYSSETVPSGLRIAAEPPAGSLVEMTTSALAAVGLQLREVAHGRFVVDRLPVAPVAPAAAADAGIGVVPAVASADVSVAPLDEVLVVANRDRGVTGEALGQRQIEHTPAAGSDALRALRSLPGIAADTSARPYVRGASQEDVLVVFDHVPIPDPFHLNNFQNLSSVFDSSVVDRMTLYSAGFPARFGTRAGGVVDITPHRVAQGHEEIVGAGLSGVRFSTAGHAVDAPVEWLAAIRRTTVDPAQEDSNSRFGEPVAIDALARLHWEAGSVGSFTAAALLLDDRVRLQSSSGLEDAEARNRETIAWLTHDYRFSGGTGVRTTLRGRHVESDHSGVASRPGLMSGTLDDRRLMESVSLYHAWEFTPAERLHWDVGVEATLTSGRANYLRTVEYDPAGVQSLTIAPLSAVDNSVSLRSITYASYASLAQTVGRRFEYEAGLRFDGQDYPSMRRTGELSPRLDLRYRITDGIGLYAAIGRYTQAQRPDERRLEDSQFVPDRPQVSWQQSIGIDARGQRGPVWRVELYHKHWERVHPYFDNLLNERVLLPELAPYRILVTPSTSVAQGAEFSVRTQPDRVLQYWLAYTWAMVADRIERQSVSRSWDQRAALSTGVDVTRGAYSATTALRWHSGLPRTPVAMSTDVVTSSRQMEIGPRNAGRASDFLSLDLRLAWTHALSGSELEFWGEMTNALNRANTCCTAAGAATVLAAGDESRMPRRFDLGMLWRFH